MPSPRTRTPPWRGRRAEAGFYLRVGLPILLTQLSLMANSVIDTIMAGRADRLQLGSFVHDTGLDSSVELAGVAIGSGIWVSLMMFFLGFTFATTPMVAELYGAMQLRQIGLLVRRLLWAIVPMGLLLAGLAVLTAALLQPHMQPDIALVATGYLRTIAWGAPAIVIWSLLRCYSEGMTLTRPVTVITVLGVLINIPLNAIFIYGLFGLPALGGIGCAIATAVSSWLTLFILVGYMLSVRNYRLTRLFSDWRTPPHMPTLSRLFRLGTPIAVTMLVELSMFPGLALLIALKQLPGTVVAGHQIALNIAGVLYMLPLAVALTATVRIGGLRGAGHGNSLRLASRFPLLIAGGIALFNMFVLLLLREQIAAFYSSLAAVQAVAALLMLYALIFQIPDSLQGAALGILRGHSDTFVPMLCVSASYWLLGIPFGYYLAFVGTPFTPPLGIDGLWLGMIAGLTAAAVSLLLRMRAVVPAPVVPAPDDRPFVDAAVSK